MAHPYHGHREHHVAHRRVKTLMRGGGYADGGKVDDSPDFSDMTHSQMENQALENNPLANSPFNAPAKKKHGGKVEGHKKQNRFARGGRTKGHQTNIAIVMPHRNAAPAVPMAGGPAGAPPMPVPPAPGGAPAPMMPPGMPMRARGGRTPGGEPTTKNLKGWAGYASKNSYARGGGLPTAGAESGVGRLQKARRAK